MIAVTAPKPCSIECPRIRWLKGPPSAGTDGAGIIKRMAPVTELDPFRSSANRDSSEP